ncbi:MAG: ABC transporter substrate-binding protein, partial [Kiritimatiellia bacterium]|nr:ABC transporter substrate-binding protein [Kiritimatiellia bacterium]
HANLGRGLHFDPAPDSPREFVEAQQRLFEQLLPRPEAERKETLRKKIRELFDFNGFARKSIGRRWNQWTPEQQTEFQQLLRDLLENLCLTHSNEIFRSHQLRLGPETRSEDRATVSGSFAQDEVDIEVDLHLRLGENGWRVEDVVVDRLSLLESYQSQFNAYLAEHSASDLFTLLRERLRPGTDTTAPSPTPAGEKEPTGQTQP